jgi:hypothetical protein
MMPKSATSFIKLGIGSVFFGLWFVTSCTFDKGEVILPVTVEYCDSLQAADSTIVSFQCDVRPILEANCTFACHTQSTAVGQPYLDTYEFVEIVADDGSLMCSINWDGGCENMPYLSGTKIDSVDRVTIQEWINNGKAE